MTACRSPIARTGSPRIDVLAGCHHGDPLDEVRGVRADLLGHLGDGQDPRVGAAQVVRVEVVRVQVGDEDDVGAVHRLRRR